MAAGLRGPSVGAAGSPMPRDLWSDCGGGQVCRSPEGFVATAAVVRGVNLDAVIPTRLTSVFKPKTFILTFETSLEGLMLYIGMDGRMDGWITQINL